jgi:hypothetical protein
MDAALLDVETREPFAYRPDTAGPLRFTALCLVYLYVLQYPMSKLLPINLDEASYDYADWLVAYGFVFVSAAIFMSTMYYAMTGPPVILRFQFLRQKSNPLKFAAVVGIFALFFAWSYAMLKLHIGMTFYVDFDPLPFRLTGLLFYGRLLVQPVILAYIADSYSHSRLRWLLLGMLAALGAWAALTSGSRFIGIMFAVPMMFLFHGRRRYLVFAAATLVLLTISTLTRNLYLPYEIGGDYIDIYANTENRDAAVQRMHMDTISYLIARPMGMGEVLMTLGYGDISHNLQDSLRTFVSFFFPQFPAGNTATVKNVYGLPDDAFGGYGLDLFSNLWVGLGGAPLLYGFGLGLIAWLLGKTYRFLAIALTRFNFDTGRELIFMLLFVLVVESRGFLFPYLLVVSWLLARESTARLVLSMFVGPRRA